MKLLIIGAFAFLAAGSCMGSEETITEQLPSAISRFDTFITKAKESTRLDEIQATIEKTPALKEKALSTPSGRLRSDYFNLLSNIALLIHSFTRPDAKVATSDLDKGYIQAINDLLTKVISSDRSEEITPHYQSIAITIFRIISPRDSAIVLKASPAKVEAARSTIDNFITLAKQGFFTSKHRNPESFIYDITVLQVDMLLSKSEKLNGLYYLTLTLNPEKSYEQRFCEVMKVIYSPTSSEA